MRARARWPQACRMPRRPGAVSARPVSRHADVVVIGAGFAGLTAARELAKDDRSVSCSRPATASAAACGTGPSAAARSPRRGGTFVGSHPEPHPRPGRRARRRTRSPPTTQGENVYFADGTRMTYSDSGPTGTAPPDPSIVPDLATVGARLDEMSKEVPIDAPWEAASAADWDRQTLEQWINENSVSPRFQQARAGGHAADLRRRAARAVAAVHALLHRRVGRRAQRRHLRAQLQHARRRADVPLRGRLAGASATGWRAGSARA